MGNTLEKKHGNGAVTTYTYNPRNFLTGMTNRKSAGSGGAVVSSYAYTYDKVGNLYRYVGNNPVNESDPSGQDPTNWDIALYKAGESAKKGDYKSAASTLADASTGFTADAFR